MNLQFENEGVRYYHFVYDETPNEFESEHAHCFDKRLNTRRRVRGAILVRYGCRCGKTRYFKSEEASNGRRARSGSQAPCKSNVRPVESVRAQTAT